MNTILYISALIVMYIFIFHTFLISPFYIESRLSFIFMNHPQFIKLRVSIPYIYTSRFISNYKTNC